MTRRNNAASQGINRRSFLEKAATIGAAASVPISVSWALPSQAGASLSDRAYRLGRHSIYRQQPAIRPRSDWDQGNGPTGPIEAEEPLFLLVHHTAQPGNDYAVQDVPGLLRSMYWFHSGDEKGWADIAYNFLVDQFGTIWEGRTGSIAGPVRGSATGGNQGFSQLCCFIGNLSETDPTPAATDSMVELLAWLAVQRNIDIQPGATVTFTSRGSNKWPRGTEITTPTIAGHRDMSQTSCPGDKGYAFVTSRLPVLVLATVTGEAPPPPADNPDPEVTTTSEPPTSEPSTTEPSTTEPAEPVESSTTNAATAEMGSSNATSTSETLSSTKLGSELDENSLSVQSESTGNNWPDGAFRWALPAVAAAAGGAVVFHRTSRSDETDRSGDSGSPNSTD